MTRERLSRFGLTAFDVLLIAGVAIAPVVGWKGLRLVEWGLLPLLLAPVVWRRLVPDRIDLWAIVLFAQYGILVSVNALLYPRISATSGDAQDKVVLYLGAAVLFAILVMRFRMTRDVARLWRIIGPAAVIASVCMLGWDHFSTPPPDNCRVGFLAKFVLFPPFWMTVLALASYCDWDRMSGPERWLRHLALALVILATAAFSGARAVLFAQAVAVPILALLLGMGEPPWQRIRMIAVVGLTAFAGLAGGIVLDQRSGCGFADRLIATGLTLTRLDDADALARERYSKRLAADGAAEIPDVVQRDAPAERTQRKAPAERSKKSAEVDRDDGLVGSVYIRPVLWADSLERIGEAPLLGHGILNEPDLVIGDFPHYHEQYLSWLVWGGPLMLVSGLLMLFAPLMVFGVRQSRDGAVLALAMIGPVAVSFLAGSYLLHTVMVLGYVTTLALLYALARERALFGWRMPRSDAVDASGEMAAQ